MSNLDVTEAQFEKEVLESDVPVLVDFWAAWCGPCKAMNPVVAELAKELGDAVKVRKVDVDAEQQLARKYNVRSIPTFLVFKRGEVVGQSMGQVSKKSLVELLTWSKK